MSNVFKDFTVFRLGSGRLTWRWKDLDSDQFQSLTVAPHSDSPSDRLLWLLGDVTLRGSPMSNISILESRPDGGVIVTSKNEDGEICVDTYHYDGETWVHKGKSQSMVKIISPKPKPSLIKSIFNLIFQRG